MQRRNTQLSANILARRSSSILCAGALLLTLAACGQESGEENTRRERTARPTSTTTQVTASAGGKATSGDGLFSLVLQAGAFDTDVEITIEKLGSSPVPEATITGFYKANYTPSSAQLSQGSHVGLEFVLQPSKVQEVGESNLQIAARTNDEGDYDAFVFGTYDTETVRYTSSIDTFASFAVIDTAAYNDCACDTTAQCDASCTHCDADCDPGCGSGQWECGNGACIQSVQVCNSVPDCADGSDEGSMCAGGGGGGGGLPGLPGGNCGPEEFDCFDGTCIPSEQACDGTTQCSTTIDELLCEGGGGFPGGFPGMGNCESEQFECPDTGECIAQSAMCDGTPDCSDGADESLCGTP